MANVLIIDDDHDVTRLLETHLTEEGHRVTVTHDGKEGLSQVLKSTPDLIMLDVFLPDATGYQMCNRIRKNESTKDTPIIMMTGAARFPNQQMYGRQRGANEYIFKPFDIVEVGELVHKYIKPTASSAPAASAPPVKNESEIQKEQLLAISAFLKNKVGTILEAPVEEDAVNSISSTPDLMEPLIPMNSIVFEPHTIELKINDGPISPKQTPAPAPIHVAKAVPPTPAPAPAKAPEPLVVVSEPEEPWEPKPVATASPFIIPTARAGYIAPTCGAKERVIEFGMEIFALSARLCSTNAEKHIADQLLKAGLAVGSKLTAAQASTSVEEFAQHAGGAVRDMRDAGYWLMMIRKTGLLEKLSKTDLEKTCQSLVTMLADYAKKA